MFNMYYSNRMSLEKHYCRLKDHKCKIHFTSFSDNNVSMYRLVFHYMSFTFF